MRTNALVRDMDLAKPGLADARRLEIVVDGLPLRGRAQLAVDTTLVCALHADGNPRRNAASEDGVALKAAKRKKVRTYPELVGPNSRAQLVVLAVEVGGRWSSETRAFLSQLAKARAREEVPLIRRRAEQAWRLRWGAMLGCVQQRRQLRRRCLTSSTAMEETGGHPPHSTSSVTTVMRAWLSEVRV